MSNDQVGCYKVFAHRPKYDVSPSRYWSEEPSKDPGYEDRSGAARPQCYISAQQISYIDRCRPIQR